MAVLNHTQRKQAKYMLFIRNALVGLQRKIRQLQNSVHAVNAHADQAAIMDSLKYATSLLFLLAS